MNNFKSKKIHNLWNEEQLLQNEISNLQNKQKNIDANRKNKLLHLCKKIYSKNSGWITPVIFPGILWKETWDLMPSQSIDKIIDGEQESGGNQLDFSGDRDNIWRRIWAYSAGYANATPGTYLELHINGNQSWSAEIITDNHYLENTEAGVYVTSSGSLSLDLLSGFISSKLKLFNKKLYLNADLSYSMTGSIIDGHLRVGTYEVQGTAHPTPIDGEDYCPYISQIYLRVYFNTGESIVYYDQLTNTTTNTEWQLPAQSSSIKWISTDLNGFNRCIYDDYTSVFGEEPSESTVINKIYLRARAHSRNMWELIGTGYGFHPTWLWHNEASINMTLDTVKVLYI